MATKKTQTTALVKWDEELAKQAEIAAKVGISTGTLFTFIRNGMK